jgi:hypothetical protein
MPSVTPYLVTRFLHPLQGDQAKHRFPASIVPVGLEEFLAPLGLGSFCSGLTILTPSERARLFTPDKLDNQLAEGLRRNSWDPGVLNPDDIKESMVVAHSDEGDTYLTCPRYGKQILEMPRHHHVIRFIGENIADLLTNYTTRYEDAFPYFDPWPYCCRRCAIGFDIRPDIGLENLYGRFQDTWGIADIGSPSTTDRDSYQDFFVPSLHAYVGLNLQDLRPAKYRSPEGTISVGLTLDIDLVERVVAFAKPLMFPNHEVLKPNMGRACEHATAQVG